MEKHNCKKTKLHFTYTLYKNRCLLHKVKKYCFILKISNILLKLSFHESLNGQLSCGCKNFHQNDHKN